MAFRPSGLKALRPSGLKALRPQGVMALKPEGLKVVLGVVIGVILSVQPGFFFVVSEASSGSLGIVLELVPRVILGVILRPSSGSATSCLGCAPGACPRGHPEGRPGSCPGCGGRSLPVVLWCVVRMPRLLRGARRRRRGAASVRRGSEFFQCKRVRRHSDASSVRLGGAALAARRYM